MENITEILINLAKRDNLDLSDMTLKLAEETGELAEAVLVHKGVLRNKILKEKVQHEAADVIMCAIAVVVKAYPQLSAGEISDMIDDALSQKAIKWKNVIATREGNTK